MKTIKLSFLLLILILTSSCFEKPYEKEFFAMDTVMNIKMYGNDDFSDINEQITKYDALFDRADKNSEIFQINTHTKTEISEETSDLLNISNEMYEFTKGTFNIKIAPVMDLWGFYGQDYKVPEKIDLDVLNQELILEENTAHLIGGAIDLGGIAKGYLSDKLAETIRNKGVTSSVISLGGNVYCIGKKPNGENWNIGITNPKDTSSAIGSVKVHDTAVVTSGTYERGFYDGNKYYHHIIDPKTGYPAKTGLSSVTVISKSGTKADALSTALFVMGMEKAMELKTDEFEVIFITDENEIYITEGLEGIFSSEYEYAILKNPKR